jgi:hypothetical protein
MNNKKRYQKIFVNDNCVVDFTEQSINAHAVLSGNTFFGTDGQLKKGLASDVLSELFTAGSSDYKLPRVTILNTADDFDFWTVYAMSTQYHVKLSELKINIPPEKQMSYLDNYCICTSSVCEQVARFSVSISGNISQNAFNTILNCEDNRIDFYNDPVCKLYHAVYTDKAGLTIPNNVVKTLNRYAINGTFGTTKDGLFNYIKTEDNKIYIISANENILPKDSYYVLDFPDLIEDCPVVHLGDLLLAREDDSISIGHLPCYLETMSAAVFPDISISQKELPSTLKQIQGSPCHDLSREFNVWSSMRLGENTLPDSLDGFTLLTNSSCLDDIDFSMTGVGLNLDGSFDTNSTNVGFIGTINNPYAFLMHLGNEGPIEGDTLIIPDSCKQIATTHLDYLWVNKLVLPANLKCFNPAPEFDQISNDYIKEISFNPNCTLVDYNPTLFENFYKLEQINLPQGFNVLGNNAFYACSNLKKVILPETFTFLGNDIFSSSTSNLTLELKCAVPPQCYSTSSLPNISKISKIIIPKGSTAAYSAATIWKNYTSKFEEAAE